jgi:hypothetical protein
VSTDRKKRRLRQHDALYISVDVEADGPIPGINNMWSIGAAAFDIERNLLGTFSANLLDIPGATADPKTMSEFWLKPSNKAAYDEVMRDRRDPAEAMGEYLGFLKSFKKPDGSSKRPIFIGYPSAYDFMWSHWYLIRFTGEDPCGHQAMDLKTYASAVLGCAYADAAKGEFPRHWSDGCPRHTHIALDDAIGQGILGINVIRENLGLPHLGDKPYQSLEADDNPQFRR